MRISALLLVFAGWAGLCSAAVAQQTCPSNFVQYRGDARPLTCVCPAGSAAGSVWGTLTYSDDSSICAAAVHAGAIPASGGEVTVEPAPGCQSYAPSVRNGISTSLYGAWGRSFFFSDVGPGKC